MSSQEKRSSTSSSTKWSAIRSKAVPSNVVPRASDSSLTEISAAEMMADRLDNSEKLTKSDRAAKNKADLPPRIHKPAFVGSTGSSRI